MRKVSWAGSVLFTLLATRSTPAFASPDSFACQSWFMDLICGSDQSCRELIDSEFSCGLFFPPDDGDPSADDTGVADTGAADTDVFVQIDTDASDSGLMPGEDTDTLVPGDQDTDIVVDTHVYQDWGDVVVDPDTDVAADTDPPAADTDVGTPGTDTGTPYDTGAGLVCTGDITSGDSDGDGTCDNLDACPWDVTGDSDGDSVCDLGDLCPGEDDLADADQDTVPDCLDACAGDDRTGDDDLDGLCNDVDACPIDDHNDSDWDGVCDSLDLCDGDDATGDRDFDGLCDDQDFVLDVARVGRTRTMRCSVGNALPGSVVYVLASVSGTGDGPCVPNSPVCLDLLAPAVVARGLADKDGHATLSVVLPRSLWRQAGLQLQAAWVDAATHGADVSNVVARTAQP